MTNTHNSVRLNITLPKDTVVALRAVVSERGKSNFIAQAIEEKLAHDRWEKAFNSFQALPATLTHITDPVQWIEELRHEDDERLDRSNL